MTKTLILMRHAKSSWDDPWLADHDRPLNKRGRKSAKAMGKWLRAGGYVPDQALVSTSLRTRETYDRLRMTCAAEYVAELYHAEAAEMLEALRRASGQTVLMLGHNLGIADFANRLVRAAPDHPRFEDYPTCATLVARFDIADWRAADWGTAEPVGFAIPREVLA